MQETIRIAAGIIGALSALIGVFYTGHLLGRDQETKGQQIDVKVKVKWEMPDSAKDIARKASKYDAEKAKESCKSAEDIPTHFDPVIEKNSYVSMIHYIRGETYEKFSKKTEACSDFTFAHEKFKKDGWEDEWREKAQDAMNRVCTVLNDDAEGGD